MKYARMLLLIGSLVVAGCGSDPGEEKERAAAATVTATATAGAAGGLPPEQLRYEKELRDIVNARIPEVRGVPEAGPDATLEEQAPQARAAGRLMLAVAEDFAKVEPPAEVRVAHEDYVAGNRAMGRFMTRVAGAMARGDEKAVFKLQEKLASGRFPSALRLRRARAEFEALGYRLPGEVAPGKRPPDKDLEPGEGQVPVPPDAG